MLSVLPAFIGGTMRLNKAYKGPILNVYNGTTTKDVWSVNEIAAFCGASNGFVATIYDQSGNGRDYTQATTTARPKIYDGTTGLLRNGSFGPIIMRFDGTDDFLSRSDSLGLSTASDWTQLHLAKNAGTQNSCYWSHGTLAGTATRISFEFDVTLSNSTRVAENTGVDIRYTDSAGAGTLSKSFHYDVVEITHGVNMGSGSGAVWRINGTALSVTIQIDGNKTAPNNLDSTIGSRGGLDQFCPVDIAVMGLWTPKLGATDRDALEKWAEMWRVQ